MHGELASSLYMWRVNFGSYSIGSYLIHSMLLVSGRQGFQVVWEERCEIGIIWGMGEGEDRFGVSRGKEVVFWVRVKWLR